MSQKMHPFLMPYKHSVYGVHVYQLHINMFPLDSLVRWLRKKSYLTIFISFHKCSWQCFEEYNKKIGHHACLGDVMGQTYPIYANKCCVFRMSAHLD